jgi:hypothetical protein
MLVIPVDKVVDPKKNNWTKWRAEEEERGGAQGVADTKTNKKLGDQSGFFLLPELS